MSESKFFCEDNRLEGHDKAACIYCTGMAMEADLARLRAKVTRIRDHIERGGAHPELTAAVILCGEILGYYPSPAEAGEKPCAHPSFNDGYCDSCGAPVAPSDAKAGERP